MQSILIAGIIVSALGTAILAVSTICRNLNVWIVGSLKDRLGRTSVAIVGLIIFIIGVVLLLWAARS